MELEDIRTKKELIEFYKNKAYNMRYLANLNRKSKDKTWSAKLADAEYKLDVTKRS